MTEDLKNRILYSNELTDLILTGNVLGIYIGGSRLYNLETPDSDYDIIVVVNNSYLINFNKKPLSGIKDYKVHMHINPIDSIIDTLKTPTFIPNINYIGFLLDSFLLTEETILYSTTQFIDLINLFNKHKESLTILALEKILNNLTNRVIKPITNYNKLYYRILFTYFLLYNYIERNTIEFTKAQKDILLVMKTNHIIHPIIYEVLENLKPHNFYTNKYSYDAIYQEVLKYE